MTSQAAHEVKQRVRDAVDVVDLINSYLPLHRRGRVYHGLCPFHDDTNPSLRVDPDRQTYKCWSCGAGGDVFSFVMQRENLEFREALELLADRAGIELPRGAPGKVRSDSRKVQWSVMAWAAERYQECLLRAEAAAPAREYLQQRGLNWDTVGKFRLGFAPPQWSWLIQQASAAGYSTDLLASVGLISRSEKSPDYFDRFRRRLMFPIWDAQGRVIAFGGRILPGDPDPRAAKYVNTAETSLFTKSRHLYGLHLAREVAQRDDQCLVMEGYTDVMMAWQHGLPNTVAVLGTALGVTHLQLLQRYVERVFLILDGDEAGRRRADEVLELFMLSPLDVRIVTLPSGLDPCDFLIAEGVDRLRELMQTAPDALTYRLHRALDGVDPARDVHAANRALEEILKLVALIPVGQNSLSGQWLRVRQAVAVLGRAFHIPPELIQARLDALRQATRSAINSPSQPAQQPVHQQQPLDAWDAEFLSLILSNPTLMERAVAEFPRHCLCSASGRDLWDFVRRIAEQYPVRNVQDLLLHTEEAEVKALLVDLESQGSRVLRSRQTPLAVYEELLQAFRHRSERLAAQSEWTKLEQQALSEKEQMDAVQQIVNRQRNRQGIFVP